MTKLRFFFETVRGLEHDFESNDNKVIIYSLQHITHIILSL